MCVLKYDIPIKALVISKGIYWLYKVNFRDFSGGPVVKNPPSNTVDPDPIPGQELRSHRP